MRKQVRRPTPTDSYHWERLMQFVVKGATDDECWGWTGDAIKDGGHGRIRINRLEYVASRLSYAIHTGRDPGAKSVCHRCDNPLCTNPRHLFLGTHDAAAALELDEIGPARIRSVR